MGALIPSKQALFARGVCHIKTWCLINGVEMPAVEQSSEPTDFGTCAYYRDGIVRIWVPACASVGVGGRLWSYPGYIVDRTPYGVLAHELGHHVERAHGVAGGIVAREWRQQTQEPPLTGYCPNTNEWFAEIFRLYVTNPDLLALVRPRTYALLSERWQYPAEIRDWRCVLAESSRHIQAAENKIKQAQRPMRKQSAP